MIHLTIKSDVNMNQILLSFFNTTMSIEIEADNAVKQLDMIINKFMPSAPNIKTKDIKKTIVSLKNKNSTGIDGVSNKVIKLLQNHQMFIKLHP